MYAPFYILVVRDVINSSTGGGERNDHALLRKTGELLVVIDTRYIIKPYRGRGRTDYALLLRA